MIDMTAIRRPKQAGFSLLELSIIIAITGIMMAGLLSLYKSKIEQQRLERMNDNRHAIQKALVDYITDDALITDDYTGQRYPCPADPALAPGQAGFGAESVSSPDGGCLETGDIKKVTVAGMDIFIGALPVITIGLGSDVSYDVHKNQYTYAVSGNLAMLKTMVNTDATGAIQIIAENGDTIINGAQFAVISHGQDGKGAYTLSGVRLDCTSGAKDTENCDDDGVFRSMRITQSEDSNFYDDSIFTSMGDDVNDGWMQSTDTTQMHIITKNAGNLGVGVSGRAPTEKLEVVGGNIKTDEDVEAGNAVKAKYFYYTD